VLSGNVQSAPSQSQPTPLNSTPNITQFIDADSSDTTTQSNIWGTGTQGTTCDIETTTTPTNTTNCRNTKPTFYPYNQTQPRNKSLDFRLLVDNTVPDKQDSFSLSGFCDQDGILADTITPEKDRLNPTTPAGACGNSAPSYGTGLRYITKGNQIQFTTKTERNQRVRLNVKAKDKGEKVGDQTTTRSDTYSLEPIATSSSCGNGTGTSQTPQTGFAGSSQVTTANKTTTKGTIANGNATQTLSNPTGVTPSNPTGSIGTPTSIISKFTEYCNTTFTYNLNDIGSHIKVPYLSTNPNEQGYTTDPRFYYDFTYTPIDLAGNTPTNTGVNQSIESSTLTVYHDKQAPGKDTQNNSISQGRLTVNYAPQTQNGNTTTGGEPVSLGTNSWNGYQNTAGTPLNLTNGTGDYSYNDITRSTTLTTQTNTEAMADNEQQLSFSGNSVTGGVTTNQAETKLVLSQTPITIRDDTYQQISTQLSKVIVQDGVGNSTTANQFGKQNTDEADNCIQISNTPIKNRRVGTCSATQNTNQTPITNLPTPTNPTPTQTQLPSQTNNGGDGLYTLRQRAIDTSGNRGEWTQKVVERDTVSPSSPTLTLTAPGIKGEQTLTLTVSGEGYAKTSINIYKKLSNVLVKNLDPNLTSNGDYTSSNLIGQLECDEDGTGNGYNYTVKVTLKDRAGNISGEVTATIKTLPCPRCVGTSTGGWSNPIHDFRVRETSGYRTSQRPDHNGADLNIGQDENGNTISGTPIYPAKDGTVEYARYSYTDAERWTPDGNGGYLDTSNYVIINHNDGTKTHYVHLQYSQSPIVTQNQTVTTNTVIGYMGQTGQATAPHLHFGVFINGVDTDPSQPSILNLDGDDATASQQATRCRKVGEGELSPGQIDWQYNSKTQQPITLTFKKNIWPLSGGYLESISGEASPEITRVVKKTDELLGTTSDVDSEGGKYNLYGIAPYKGQKIIIKLVDGNTIIETKEESLQTARWRARKSCNGSNGNITDEIDNNAQSGRINFQVETRWGSQICNNITTDNKVTKQNEEWIDSYLYHSTSCFGGNCELKGTFGGNYGSNSTHKTLQNNTERLLDTKTGIESSITVTGENSDTSDNGFTHDGYNRVAKFVSNENDKTTIPNNKKIWILLHGWNGSFDRQINDLTPLINDSTNATFTLDWREISHSGNVGTAGVCKAATWTRPLAIKIAQKLKSNGLSIQDVTIVGHSLGTTLGRELSEQLGGNAKLITLDPPNETQCTGLLGIPGSGARYNVQNNMPRKEYHQDTAFVRAFHGKGSPAGSKWYALGAIDSNDQNHDDAIRVDYQGSELDIHGATIDTYTRLIGWQKLQDNYLDKNDDYGWNWKIQCNLLGLTFNCYDGFKGDLLVRNRSIEKLKYYDRYGNYAEKYPI
jgi:pimeloyl-ACP methyl ester carboxylesterase